MVKNPPSDAEDKDSIPGQGSKIPNTSGQLKPRTTAREAHTLQRRPRESKKKKKRRRGRRNRVVLSMGKDNGKSEVISILYSEVK